MIELSYAFSAYLCVGLFSLFYLFVSRSPWNNIRALPFLICYSLLVTFILGTRAFDYTTDTDRYVYLITQFIGGEDIASLQTRLEYGFLLLLHFFSIIFLDVRLTLFAMSVTFVSLWILAFFIWRKDISLFFCVVLFASLFTTYNLGANILRQGISLPLALIALHFLFSRKYLTSLVAIFLSVSMHFSGSILFAFGALAHFIDLRKHLLKIIVVSSVLAYLNVFSIAPIASFLGYDHLISFYAHSRYETGFRIFFWLFTLLPVFAFFAVKKEMLSEHAIKLFSTYIAVSSLFFIAFNIPFSDRIGLISWSLWPIILSNFYGKYKYRFLNDKVFFVVTIIISGLCSFLFFGGMQF